MPVKKKKADSPVTLAQLSGQLIKFYNTLIEPRFQKIEEEVGGLRKEVGGLRQEIRSRFDDLYKKF